MLKIATIAWGGADVAAGVEFWTAALDYVAEAEPDIDWVLLRPRDGEGVQLAIDQKQSDHQRRHHMDLYSDDQQAEVDRLIALGATAVDWEYPADADYIVLADPNGNNFCVVQV